MGSECEEVEEQFFDTREDAASVSGSSCGDGECECTQLSSPPGGALYEVWAENGSLSIHERRNKFLKWMGLAEEEPPRSEVGTARVTESSGAVLGSSGSDEDREAMTCRIRNLDDGTEFVVDELDHVRRVGSGNLLTVEEFERSLGMSRLVQSFMQKSNGDSFNSDNNSDAIKTQVKRKWLKRISAVSCVVDRQLATRSINCKARKVRVRSYKKRSKELSALYMLQDLQAHLGPILTMKFSPDGEYLASAGEDGIVRVWHVVETERSHQFNVSDSDASCSYWKINNLSEVVPYNVNSEKSGKLKSSGKTSVVFPRKIFHTLEKPVHEFHGHCGEVLDLSWSKNKLLLSSSVDKTVRLWRVGTEHCLNVFSHNSYVTSIEFNPLDDKHFISGSIDGKVRIWDIPSCQVVDWIDITEIVTAVCYRPDGKGGVVGSMNGDCRFYDLSDNHLQLYAEISLQGKKKSPLKRITGFQFPSTDPSKLMVTSADSRVRILHGVDVVSKYRGIRNAGSRISATFTNDGNHIVSASEDSNVYIWNYKSEDEPKNKPKSHWSCERFFSSNASVAIPWCGKPHRSYHVPRSNPSLCVDPSNIGDRSKQTRFLSVNPSHGIFPESALRGSATWPEEKLPKSKILKKCSSQHNFLESSWGSVIVTAGWDGRIRSFQNFGLPN